MEQGTLTKPNAAAWRRVTATGLFIATGDTSGVHLGNIKMAAYGFSPKSDQVELAVDGNNVLGFKEVIAIAPVWTITGNQYHTGVRALLHGGNRLADVVQSSATAATITITAKLGRTFDLGFRGMTNVSVAVSSVVKTDGTDYFLEANKGIIRFPNVAAGIADSASVVITYDRPAITREQYTVGDNQNNYGTLKLFGMKNNLGYPLEDRSIPGVLSPDEPGNLDMSKHSEWKMTFSVIGIETVLSATYVA